MLFWWFIVAVAVILLAGAVFQEFFWWSVIGFGVLWAVAIAVEVFWNWKQEGALSGQHEVEGPTEAPAVTAAEGCARQEVGRRHNG